MPPEEPGRKAYQLLVETLDETGYVALAKLAMHQREYLVLIRPHRNGLVLHTLYYPNEIRQLAGYGQPASVEIKPQERQLAGQLVESLAAPFKPKKYRDEFQHRLRELVEAKRQGQEVAAPPAPATRPVVDVIEALKQSLASMKRPPARAAEAQPAAASKARRAKAATRAAVYFNGRPNGKMR
jgi:DNA end-binding protein Ku